MIPRTPHLLALAASLAVGSMGYAQANNPADRGAGTANTAGTQAGSGSASGTANNTGSGQMNAQSDASLKQTMSKIAQSGEKAPDQLFALHQAASNQFEVEFSRLVSERAKDPQVKQLAQMIAQDHEQANQKLRTAVQGTDLQLPQGLPAHKQELLSVYRAMSPEMLETCYLIEQEAMHYKAISSLADHAKTLKDEKLKSYASEALPKVEQHARQIIQLSQSKNIGDTSGRVALGGMSGSQTDAMGMNQGQRQGQGQSGNLPSGNHSGHIVGTGTDRPSDSSGTSGTGAAGSGAAGTGAAGTGAAGTGTGRTNTGGATGSSDTADTR